MGHDHSNSHEQPASLRNLLFAMVINGGIVVFEMIFGLMIQSMALISDAVHNLSDIAAMISFIGRIRFHIVLRMRRKRMVTAKSNLSPLLSTASFCPSSSPSSSGKHSSGSRCPWKSPAKDML